MKALLLALTVPTLAFAGINDPVDLLTPRLPEKKDPQPAATPFIPVLFGEITRVTPYGIFLFLENFSDSEREVTTPDRLIFVKGYSDPNAAEGQKLKVAATRDGVVKYDDVNGAERTLENWKFLSISTVWIGETR